MENELKRKQCTQVKQTNKSYKHMKSRTMTNAFPVVSRRVAFSLFLSLSTWTVPYLKDESQSLRKRLG
ncbi:hypothetical protein J6590_102680, partial [Homalodisca vitripennis]